MDDSAPILHPAARILLIDQQGRILPLRATVGQGAVWITPGGAIEPGETAEEAACRELREETGAEPPELSRFVWTRVNRFESVQAGVWLASDEAGGTQDHTIVDRDCARRAASRDRPRFAAGSTRRVLATASG